MDLGPIPPWLQRGADPAENFARGMQIGAQIGAQRAHQAASGDQLSMQALGMAINANEARRAEQLRLQQLALEQQERERLYAAQEEYSNLIKGGMTAPDALLKVGPRLGSGAGSLLAGALEMRGAPPPVPTTVKTPRGDVSTYLNARTGGLVTPLPEELFMPVPPGGGTGPSPATQIKTAEGKPTGYYLWEDEFGKKHTLPDPYGRTGAITEQERIMLQKETERIDKRLAAIQANQAYQVYQDAKSKGQTAPTGGDYARMAWRTGQAMSDEYDRLQEERQMLLGKYLPYAAGVWGGGAITPPPGGSSKYKATLIKSATK